MCVSGIQMCMCKATHFYEVAMGYSPCVIVVMNNLYTLLTVTHYIIADNLSSLILRAFYTEMLKS